jgi:hypothetical protein
MMVGIFIMVILTTPVIPGGVRMHHEKSAQFWETVSSHGLDSDIAHMIQQYECKMEAPAIHFPLPGEVFRTGDIVEINGTSSMPDFQNYTIEWGVGLNPTEWFTDGVTLVNNGTVALINATLGFWDTASITDAGYYTILLTVHLLGSGQSTVNVSIYLDPTLHLNFPFGWPHEIQGSQVAIWSPIALSDINHDGYQEIGFGTVTVVPAGDNNYDYVIDQTGTVLLGWPIQMYGIQGASLTFADIDASTSNDEVIGGMWGEQVYVWHDNGTVVDGWPKSIYTSRASATVCDLDRDGDWEIILTTTEGGGRVYALHHNATMVAGWPVRVGSPIRSAASVADINKDGYPEVLFGDQNGVVYALLRNGSAVPGWPQQANDFIKTSPVIADLDGDGDLEVIINSGFTQQRIISVYHHNGTMMAGWPQENGLPFVQPSVGDIDGDGDLEVLAGGAIYATPYARFYAWHHNGTMVAGWPIVFPWDGSQYVDFIYAQPVIGDIDGDADMEIIVGSYYKKLYAWHHNGTSVAGWPKIIGDAVDSTAAIGDIDHDGLVEVTVAGDDGKIYVWDLNAIYNSSHMEWPMFQYDPHHTGCYRGVTLENHPPAAPSIEGKVKGKVGVSYAYNFSAVDPEDDKVYFTIDWGDGTTEGWLGPYASGDVVTRNHTWTEKDTYELRAKAKDTWGAESDWATLMVTMPRAFQFDRPFLHFLEQHPLLFPFVRLLLQRFDR